MAPGRPRDVIAFRSLAGSWQRRVSSRRGHDKADGGQRHPRGVADTTWQGTVAIRGGRWPIAGHRGRRGVAVTVDPVPLTPLDRLEISELPGRYADALDLLQPEELRSVFTDDAVWEIVDGRRLVGIDEIMEFMGRPDVHPGAHLMTNVYVGSVDDADGDPVVHLRSRGIFP